jgi:hypothetical protein
MSEEAREIHPFSLETHPADRNFDPVLVPAGVEEPDPKGLSAPELAAFSDTVPEIPTDDSEKLETPAIVESDLAGAAKASTPPRVPKPGKPTSS